MTNAEAMTKKQMPNSAFESSIVIPASSLIRHSTFVISQFVSISG